ncbi:hypothetical protein ALC57_00659 [Trachymyrmex cornetzi]|uniref:Uncharacterized protein n=1 Tax=Trachymyrmex cornetzi TaxID=471704 RepID=A0A151JRE4_9HYME|nr:hypothetical protein ALC57_00659 [Trachymyrmex cornetzi]
MSRAAGGATYMNVVQHRAAGRPTEGRSLSDCLLVNFAVHDDHHDTRNPKGHTGTDHRIWEVHHEHANLRLQKSKHFQLHKTCRIIVKISPCPSQIINPFRMSFAKSI